VREGGGRGEEGRRGGKVDEGGTMDITEKKGGWEEGEEEGC
jgi:hypothetical protein